MRPEMPQATAAGGRFRGHEHDMMSDSEALGGQPAPLVGRRWGAVGRARRADQARAGACNTLGPVRLGVSGALLGDQVVAGDVAVRDGVVEAVGLVPAGRGSALAVPGLIDLQVNGVGEVDFATADPDAWTRAGRVLARSGTTAFRPTFVTDRPDRMAGALAGVPRSGLPAKVLGAHLEGPFISERRLGAHRGDLRLDPDPQVMRLLLGAGPVRQVTLAPELPGAAELIDMCVGAGVTVACGHSDASAAEAASAFERGAAVVTHLFNAMRTGDHRDPGLALAALSRSDVHVTVIADGVHVATEALLVAWRAARGRLALVSDMVPSRMAGVPLVPDGRVLRRADGTLAGSAGSLLDGVRFLVGAGVPLVDAVLAATRVPATIAGTRLGSITPGGPADLVVIDDRLGIATVMVDGVEVTQ